jgi:D-alanyl-D-alanine carboxypeptidase/D-alanyl-D-alanine-endopeptidase (penicillin-binding protein 4)
MMFELSLRARILGLLLAAGVGLPVAADLRDDVQTEIRRADLGDAVVAVSVHDVRSGESLADVNASEPMVPASNMKLLTSGAALHILGPDFEFATRLYRDGDRLTIVGGGDPSFGDEDLLRLMDCGERRGCDLEEMLALWVNAVRAGGLSSVSAVIVDDRVFDRDFVHRSWPPDQLNAPYCAEVCGLNFHRNVLDFFPRPGADGRPDLSAMRPNAGWLQIVNRATSRRGANDGNDVWIARSRDGNDLTFYGNVKHAYQAPASVVVHDMPAFFARLLAERIGRAGVTVERHGVAGAEDAPAGTGQLLEPVFATPIGTVLVRCNRDSENLYAEALLKRIGREVSGVPGSWSNGAAAVRQAVRDRLAHAGLAGNLIVDDGSGLSRENRVAAATLTAWLDSFAADPKLGDLYVASLARPGQAGTLKERFRGANLNGVTVQAKSGYIRSVSCLSGYLTAPDGRRRSFAILVNGLHQAGTVARAKRLQERVVTLIARDMTAPQTAVGSD